MLENIIGVNEAAELSGLTPGTVKNYCAIGKYPSKKIGKTWIIDKVKLEEMLEMRKLTVNKLKKHEHIVGEEYTEEYYARDSKAVDLYIGHELTDADEDEQSDIDFIYELKNGSYTLDIGDFWLDVEIEDADL